MGQSTEALASKIGVLPQTLRGRLCRFGSYFGLMPTTLANGRLSWPDDGEAVLRELADTPEQQAVLHARTEKMRTAKSQIRAEKAVTAARAAKALKAAKVATRRKPRKVSAITVAA